MRRRQAGPLRRLVAALVRGRAAGSATGDVVRDIAYGADPAQTMDIHGAGASALQRQPSRPVMLVVHGGGWTIGDKARSAVVDQKVAHWVPRGWLLVSVNYRLVPEAGPAQQADDIARALAAVQQRAGEWGGDGSRCVLMGHSSGAHLVAWVAVDAALRQRHGASEPTACVLLDGSALDVPALMEGQPLRLHRRVFGDDPAAWRVASPLHRMHAAPVPTLLLCSSERDGAVEQAQAYARQSVAYGGRADVLALPLRHAELNSTIGEPGAATEAIDRFLSSLESS